MIIKNPATTAARRIAQLLELPLDSVSDIAEIMKAETFDSIKALYEKAPEGSKNKTLAERKWDRLTLESLDEAETVEDFAKVYAESREDSEPSYSALEGLYEHMLANQCPWKP